MEEHFARSVVIEEVGEEMSEYGVEDSVQGRHDRLQADVAREGVEDIAVGVADWLDRVPRDDRSSDGSSGASGGPSGELTATAAAVVSLRELSRRVERIMKQRMAVKYRRARVMAGAPHRGKIVNMLQFSLSGVRTLSELETAGGIYDELNSGQRVATQIAARTAIGKTTIFPSRLAVRCNMRVLLVEPSTLLAVAAAKAQSSSVQIRRAWQERRVAALTTMSYDDFCGAFRSKSGADMLQQFDVIIFDEAHLKIAAVEAAKTIVASYPTTASLLVCSATMPGNNVQNTADVKTSVTYTSTTLRDLASRGHLTRTVGQDRTLVLAADDEEAQFVSDVIVDNGLKALTLDSASRRIDVTKARDYLNASADITNRYLVAVAEEYGVGHNFPVGKVVVSGKKTVFEMNSEGNELVKREVACTRSEVEQQVARAGRGIVAGATALVCVEEKSLEETDVMTYSEQLRYYFMLIAAHIRPTKELSTKWRALLPFGVNVRVASDVLAVNLPVEVAIRFFAKDGRVPFAYADALQAFSEDQHEFAVSEFDQPHGYELWCEEPMTGYYDANVEKAPMIMVPCRSTGNYRVAIHAVCAAALGLMRVENWQPQFSESENSETEEVQPRSPSAVYRPRLIETGVYQKPLPRAPITRYAYDVPQERQAAARMGLLPNAWEPDVMRSLASCDTDVSLMDFSVKCEIEKFTERDRDRVGIRSAVTKKEDSPNVGMHSPGGTIVMSFRSSVWKKMVTGEALYDHDAYSFFHSIRENIQGFVSSDALSGWTDVWFSVFRTASSPENIALIKKKNYTARIVALMMAMVTRYTRAVKEVSATSQVKSSVFAMMVRSLSTYDDVVSHFGRRGQLELAQSEKFMRRVFDIRSSMAQALMLCEDEGIFSPVIVSTLQNVLPLMSTTGQRVIDQTHYGKRFMTRLLKPH